MSWFPLPYSNGWLYHPPALPHIHSLCLLFFYTFPLTLNLPKVLWVTSFPTSILAGSDSVVVSSMLSPSNLTVILKFSVPYLVARKLHWALSCWVAFNEFSLS
jgi:hypothetical protein